MRTLLAAGVALAVAGAASGALAARSGDPRSRLSTAFGNTIVSTHPDGRKAKLWLSADGKYAAQGRAGNRSSGHWKVKGGKLCLTQHAPVPIPLSYCTAIPSEQVGRPWRDKAVNGDLVTNEIVKGADGAR
jgi:hypothetical protein